MNDNELRDKLQKEWYEKAKEARKNAVILEEIENADERGAYRSGWQDGANWAYKLAIEEILQLREAAKKLAEALYSTSYDRHGYCLNMTGAQALAEYRSKFPKEEK